LRVVEQLGQGALLGFGDFGLAMPSSDIFCVAGSLVLAAASARCTLVSTMAFNR
jgi:hypothetical protein